MFIVGAVGVVVVGAAAHGDYSDHSRHSQYTEYGDAELLSQINKMEDKIYRQENDLDSLRYQVQNNFNDRINELRREKNYSSLNRASSDNNLINSVKEDMKQEMKMSIRKEKEQLAEIDQMIDRINEIEFLERN